MLMSFSRMLIFSIALVASFTNAMANNLPDFTALVEANSNAVVNISTTQKSPQLQSFLPPDFEIPENAPYGDLLKHFFGERGAIPRQRDSHSLGSGFIICRLVKS
jgi:serine protease Do